MLCEKPRRSKSTTPWIIAAVRLLTFTGARLGEILTLEWQHVDDARGLLMLPDSKTGRKAVHLKSPGSGSSPRHPSSRGQSLRDLWREARAASCKPREALAPSTQGRELDDVRLHDLRHSFASVAASGGQSLLVIGKMLGHSQPATTARYAHLADDPLKAANDAVGRRIAAAMGGGSIGEVVDLPSDQRAATKVGR